MSRTRLNPSMDFATFKSGRPLTTTSVRVQLVALSTLAKYSGYPFSTTPWCGQGNTPHRRNCQACGRRCSLPRNWHAGQTGHCQWRRCSPSSACCRDQTLPLRCTRHRLSNTCSWQSLATRCRQSGGHPGCQIVQRTPFKSGLTTSAAPRTSGSPRPTAKNPPAFAAATPAAASSKTMHSAG